MTGWIFIAYASACPQAEQFGKRPGKKKSVGDEIALPQTARLLAQAVQPFQAGALHPERRALLEENKCATTMQSNLRHGVIKMLIARQR
jgi:hypothetical protein